MLMAMRFDFLAIFGDFWRFFDRLDPNPRKSWGVSGGWVPVPANRGSGRILASTHF